MWLTPPLGGINSCLKDIHCVRKKWDPLWQYENELVNIHRFLKFQNRFNPEILSKHLLKYKRSCYRIMTS